MLWQSGAGSNALFDAGSVSGFVGSLSSGAAATAFRTDGALLTISRTTLQDNVGAANGGVVDVFAGGNLVLLNLSLLNNTGVRGGAVFVDSSQVSFTGTLCQSNTAARTGGCVYVAGASSVLQASSGPAFKDNVAVQGDGGAIALSSTLQVTISDVICSGNRANGSGGCLWMADGKLTLSNTTGQLGSVQNNVASTGNGSGLALVGVDATVTSVSFEGNSVTTGFGGAFFVKGGSFVASGVEISGNTASALGLGGAGTLAGKGTFSIAISALEGNSFGEGVVCESSSGSAVGPSLTASSVVCGPSCVLAINGDRTVCGKQSSPGSARQSFVAGPSPLQGVQGSWVMATVFVRDVYLRPALTGGLGGTLYSGNVQVRGSVVTVANTGVVGQYGLNVSIPLVGTFSLVTLLNAAPVSNSPTVVSVVLPVELPPNLTPLWVIIGLLCGLGLCVLGVFVYRRYVRRVSYLPIADSSSKKQASYGGTGFGSEAEDV